MIVTSTSPVGQDWPSVAKARIKVDGARIKAKKKQRKTGSAAFPYEAGLVALLAYKVWQNPILLNPWIGAQGLNPPDQRG